MGVDFYCGDITFCCSYGGWNERRNSIIKYTFKYLEDTFIRDMEIYGHLSQNDDNWIGEGSSYNIYMNVIKLFGKVMTLAGPMEESILSKFIRLSSENYDIVDALIYFGVGGLFALCHKNNCEGFYSPGNSYDICKLFDNIKNTINTEEKEEKEEKEQDTNNYTYFVYDSIYNEDAMPYNCLYTLFKTSYESGKNVSIC